MLNGFIQNVIFPNAVMLSVRILNFFMPSVIILNAVILNAVMLRVVVPNAVKLNVLVPSVVAPLNYLHHLKTVWVGGYSQTFNDTSYEILTKFLENS